MQSVPIVSCFICNVPVLFSALYATFPYYLLLYMECAVVLVLDALDQLSDEDLGREELGWSVEPTPCMHGPLLRIESTT